MYVTHDVFIARHTQRIIRLVDGKIISDEPVAHPLVAGTPRPEEALESRVAMKFPKTVIHVRFRLQERQP